MPLNPWFENNPAIKHLLNPGGGLSGEIYDLRRDLEGAFDAIFGAVSGGTGFSLTAATAIALGEAVYVNAAGEADIAVSTYSVDKWRIIGTAAVGVAMGASLAITSSGQLGFGRFLVAPAASDNGKYVYLSATSGRLVLTPPGGPDQVTMIAGILVGADGATITPQIVSQPQYISRLP